MLILADEHANFGTVCLTFAVKWNSMSVSAVHERSPDLINPFRMKAPKYLFPRGNKPLLYHQIGNRNLFVFITNQ